ncbi:MAG: hypothetical protein GX916_05380 [Clostridiales bacterium]|nr:hypothetical protein [Clostridiales bacterium]
MLLVFNSAHFLPPTLLHAKNPPWPHILGNAGVWVLGAVCVGSYFWGIQVLKAKSTLPE